jgi:PAS domain S-box-containing protein
MRLTGRLWLGLIPLTLVLAAVTVGAIATSDRLSSPVALAVVYPVIGLSFAVSGLIASTLRPENATGTLLVLVGFFWLVNGLNEADNRWVFWIGNVFGSLFLAAFAHLMLAFPEGRVAPGLERRFVGFFWLTALSANGLVSLFQRHVEGCDGCPDDPVVLSDSPRFAHALGIFFSVLGGLIFLVVVVLLVRRWRGATPARRRVLGPVYLSGGISTALVTALFALGSVSAASRVFGIAAFVTFGTVPLFFLAGLLRDRLSRPAARLLREVPDEPTPEQAQDGLRTVLGDPTLEFLTWLDEVGVYVDVRGASATLQPDTARRVTTRIDRESDGHPLAALVHDAALLHQRGVLDEVVSAARLAIEKDRGLQALRRSDARNRALIGAIPDLILTIARDGTYLEVRGDPETLIVPREELIGSNVRDVLPFEVAESFVDALRAPVAKGVQTVEYRLVIGGVERHFEARMVPSGDDEVVVIVRDFTQRVELESELARRLQEVQHEQMFTRSVVNTAPIVLILCDENGGIVRMNDPTQALFGYPDDERMRGRIIWDAFIVEDERAPFVEAFRRVHPLRPTEARGRWRGADGQVRVIEASIAHIVDGQGLRRRLVAGLDVTDLIREREAVRQQRDFLSVVAAATPSFLVVVEADGTVAAEGVNRAFADVTGYDDSTAPGNPFWELVVPDELADEFQEQLADAIRQGTPSAHESPWIGTGGRPLLVEWTCRPLPEIGKYLISALDITERMQQEQEVRASRARIVEAADGARRRLERNLHDGAQQRLVSLSLALRLAQSKLRDDPDGAEQLLTGAADELTQALAELRELARGIHPAVLTDRGLPAALEALAARAPLPVELSADLEARLPGPVEAAAYYVVAEALTNIAKYAEASAVQVRAQRRNGRVVVEVADDGIGGADPRRGSGLRGLADRVEALDGELEVESTAGEGTTVRAVIPLVEH